MKAFLKVFRESNSQNLIKNDFSENQTYFYFTFTLIVLLTILPFFIISFYNHPSADDFCFADNYNSLGYWQTQLHYYNNWTGRYMATALLTISPVDYNWLLDYKLLPIFLIMLFGVSIYIFISKLLPNAILKDRLLLSFFILFLYMFKAPTMSESFYWMSASITYQVASILSLLLFSLVLHLQKQKGVIKIYYTLLGAMLCVAIVGSNEISMMLLLIVLFLWLVIRSYLRRELDKSLLVLLLVSMVASAIVVLAPGNMVRMAEKPEKFQLGYSIFKSLNYTFHSIILKWLPITILLVLFFIDLLNRISGNIRSRYQLPKISLFHILLWAVFLFSVMALSFFPSFWSQGGHPPLRAINVIYLLYIFGGMALVFMSIIYLQNHNFKIPKPLFAYKLILGLFILGFMVLKTNNIKKVYADLFKGTAYQYHLEMEERYAQLRSCVSDSCMVSPLQHKPATIFAFDLVPDSSYEVYYYNQCLSFYLDKEYISAP